LSLALSCFTWHHNNSVEITLAVTSFWQHSVQLPGTRLVPSLIESGNGTRLASSDCPWAFFFFGTMIRYELAAQKGIHHHHITSSYIYIPPSCFMPWAIELSEWNAYTSSAHLAS
jgi:hypothetical protein